MAMDFSKWLTANGYNHTTFALEIGVSKQSVGQWASGKHAPGSGLLRQLLERDGLEYGSFKRLRIENEEDEMVRQAEFWPEESRVLVWFSCGAASAVAARLAVKKYPNCEVMYCDTLKFEHPDNLRFLRDVERWIGREIRILKSDKYEDIFDVFRKTGWLVGVSGARCTTELKKAVRKKYQRPGDLHVFGLTEDEGSRIERFERQNPEDCEWILADYGVTKDDCYQIIQRAGIALPEMYLLGYNNNNCIGCVKGQMGYWNKIRVDFPEAFERMAIFERQIGVAICKTYAGDGQRKRVFLDELDPDAGRSVPEPDIDCGVLCEGLSGDLVSIYDPALPQ